MRLLNFTSLLLILTFTHVKASDSLNIYSLNETLNLSYEINSSYNASAAQNLINNCKFASITTGAVTLGLTLTTVTAGCAGVLAISGPGTLVCAVPAAGATLAGVAALLATGASYLVCNNAKQLSFSSLYGATVRSVNRIKSNTRKCSDHFKKDTYRIQKLFCNAAKGMKKACNPEVLGPQSVIDNAPGIIQRAQKCASARRYVMHCYENDPNGGHAKKISEIVKSIKNCAENLAKAYKKLHKMNSTR